MKIRGDRMPVLRGEPVKPADTTDRVKPRRSAGADRSDPVSLSAQSREAQRVKALVDKVPEIREERVRELRSAIQKGTYRVRGRDVAEKLLDDIPRKQSD